jgi:hypothetical protein
MAFALLAQQEVELSFADSVFLSLGNHTRLWPYCVMPRQLAPKLSVTVNNMNKAGCSMRGNFIRRFKALLPDIFS